LNDKLTLLSEQAYL